MKCTHKINGIDTVINWQIESVIERHDSGCAQVLCLGETETGIEYIAEGTSQSGELEDIDSSTIEKVEYTNTKRTVDQVAAGLRKMTKRPIALLYFDKQDDFYDEYSICGLPIYRTQFIYQGNGQEELRFYPLFRDPNFDSTIEVTNFRKGYEEY